MDKVAQVKRLYYRATPASIHRDVARAIELLKSMETEAEREQAAVYMDGLSQMRSDWARRKAPGRTGSSRASGRANSRRRRPRR